MIPRKRQMMIFCSRGECCGMKGVNVRLMLYAENCLNRKMRLLGRRPPRARRERRGEFARVWVWMPANSRSANNDVEFSDDEPDLNDESAVRLLPCFPHVC